jgi:cAMP phosphodiesterase
VALPHVLESGPFAGLEITSKSAVANAAHITQSLIDTYLITHPHLDHISGFIVNTAGFNGNRPKRLAGLPSTIAAFKSHIFNNVIWPNLSDENNGAGLVTYMRLVDGGSPAIGEGEGQGYLEVSDGLAVKTWSVSHGHCIERHSHRGSQSSQGDRFGSTDFSGVASPRIITTAPSHSHAGGTGTPMSRVNSLMNQASQQSPGGEMERICVYDSSAYFIRDVATGCEVLIFGDVEPDSISLSPRNLRVWQEAAPKIASGMLTSIFIECSFEDSQSDERLFGHLKPYYIVEEMRVLANEVEHARRIGVSESKKRKRDADDGSLPVRRRSTRSPFGFEEPVSPKSSKPSRGPTLEVVTPTSEAELTVCMPQEQPLRGLKVVVIHVKDKLSDGPPLGETILGQLKEHEEAAKLGCEFVISFVGQSVMA